MKNKKISPHSGLLYSFIPGFFFSFISFLNATSVAHGITRVTNPITANTSLEKLLATIINALTYIAIPFIVLAFMYAGFLFVTSLGGEGVAKAKKAFFYTAIATFIILGANVLLSVVTDTTTALLG